MEDSGVRRKKFRGGEHFRGSAWEGVRGAEPPGRRRIFENLQKIPEENGKKCCIFAYFAKKFKNHAVNFCAFGRKTQLFGKFWEIFEIFWWKFNGKIEFFSIFWENLLLKIETSEITSFFYNNFFRFGGGGVQTPPNPPPPCVRHWSSHVLDCYDRQGHGVLYKNLATAEYMHVSTTNWTSIFQMTENALEYKIDLNNLKLSNSFFFVLL